MTARHLTSAQHRRVEWKALDRAMARFSTDSLIVLLQAALVAPDSARFHDHLLLLFTRVLRTPARGGIPAGAADLPVLVEASVRAAPGRGVVTDRDPGDVRDRVRFTVAGDQLLVHPGQLAHPLLVLRTLKLTAAAVDEALHEVLGFGAEDVLELVLRLTDRSLAALSEAWPEPGTAPDSEEGREVSCRVTPAEVRAAPAIACADPAELVQAARCPERAERALQWLTCRVEDLPLRYHPDMPLLGPVLAVTAHGRRLPVPACAATEAAAPAVARLLTCLPPAGVEAAEARMQEVTVARLAQLLGLEAVPARPGPVCLLSSPSHRYDIAVVSAVADGALGARVEEGRAALADADVPAGRGRLVVYGGPRFLGPELIRDTLFLHVEEVAEILHDADGDLAVLALFVLELTEHPGVHGVFYRDALDAWSAWHRGGTLLAPGPDGDDVAMVPEAVRDEVWERAAARVGVDEALAAAGLPPAGDFRHARLSEPEAGVSGVHADLEDATSGGPVVVRAATVPPLVIVAVPSREPGAVLDAAGIAGLADSLRTALTTIAPAAAHAALPGGAPLLVQVTVAHQAHPHPDGPDPDGDAAMEEWLLLRAGADPEAGRISIDIDPPLLAAFTGDGSQGHHILGRLLHHLIEQVRRGRGAGPGTDADAFTVAWDSAFPVLRLTAATNAWPATAPAFTLPRSRHVHARALRTAAGAVRRAGVPAGTWRGPDAYRRGGPAEQLLHALERELDEQTRAYQPSLVGELARQLNAAWADRTRSAQQSAVNLAAPWAAKWIPEAGQRQVDGARATSALHLLLQQALAGPPAGGRPVDVLAVAELVALAELVLHSGITAVSAARRLHDLHLDIDPSGVFTLTSGPDPGETEAGPAQDTASGEHLGFDAHAYHRARQQRLIAQAIAAEPELPDAASVLAAPAARTETAFTAPELPAGSQLAHADRLLHQHWGCGIAGLGAVLATASDWPTGPDGTAAVTTEDLVAETATWSTLPTDHIRAAIDRLRLHPGNAAGTGPHAYAEVERRSRPLTHPLIDAGETLLVLPWLACAAREAYAAYLDDGRLPHPDLPVPVTQALLRHRQQLDQHLEREISEAVRTAGLPHRFRLLEKTAAGLGIPGLVGEIDLLVADPVTGRLWVIEAKNPTGAVAPHALLQHIQKFTTRYRDKLLAKAATVAAHPGQAAAACGVTGEQDWRVLPLMVTRTIEPAAFLADPHVPYVTAERLTAVLADPADPEPGWIRATEPAH
ncbi:hypothetical protein OIU91_42100 (plasmid) [Streptomyces sp. NBC_01456]|uniref:hypothetical protein n=1 Tax=unclassified Streptomyces TaxID=2593676 RepID=UPI002E2EE45C|nr:MULTISPECIES: hypothetical protein [unclassified Streptomyces]